MSAELATLEVLHVRMVVYVLTMSTVTPASAVEGSQALTAMRKVHRHTRVH